jgi:hypothetical protein
MAVSGDLDAGELEAIEDFLGQVDTLATEFYDGDVEAAFAAGAALAADADEIARFSVRLSLSERVSVAARVSGAPAPLAGANASSNTTPAAADADASSSQAQTGAPVAPAGADAAAPTHAASSAAPGDASGVQPVPQAPQAAPGTSAPQTASADPLATLRSFVQRVLDAARTPLAVRGVALDWRVKIELTAALFEARRPQQAAAPAEQMLDRIMDRAAAQADAQAGAAAV